MRGAKPPLAAGERGIAHTLAAKLLVVAGNDDADVGDRVGGEVVAVILGIEIGEQSVFLDEADRFQSQRRPAMTVRFDFRRNVSCPNAPTWFER